LTLGLFVTGHFLRGVAPLLPVLGLPGLLALPLGKFGRGLRVLAAFGTHWWVLHPSGGNTVLMVRRWGAECHFTSAEPQLSRKVRFVLDCLYCLIIQKRV